VQRLLLLALVFLYSSVYASITTAIVDGDWSETGTWDNGIPGCIDTIVIPAGIQVDITSTVTLTACPDSIFILISGRLNFQTGKKLKLPCDSDVIIMTGGSMGVGGGGGSSTYLEMCGTQYWDASLGDLVGPQSLCDGVCPGSQLPIELLFFTATYNEQSRMADLYWATASEIDNDYFTIERSADAINWNELFEVDGAGSSPSRIDYSDVDENPLMGDSFYRLKQTDYNGEYTYSPIVRINQSSNSSIVLYPNPSQTGNQVVIYFPTHSEQFLDVEVVSIDGKLVFQTTLDMFKSEQLILNIDNSYQSGVYFVRSKDQSIRLIVN
jgi:Secretion system C-terminal sorting domain